MDGPLPKRPNMMGDMPGAGPALVAGTNSVASRSLTDTKAYPVNADPWKFQTTTYREEWVELNPVGSANDQRVTWDKAPNTTDGQMIDLFNSFVALKFTCDNRDVLKNSGFVPYATWLLYKKVTVRLGSVDIHNGNTDLEPFAAFAKAALTEPYRDNRDFTARALQHLSLKTVSFPDAYEAEDLKGEDDTEYDVGGANSKSSVTGMIHLGSVLDISDPTFPHDLLSGDCDAASTLIFSPWGRPTIPVDDTVTRNGQPTEDEITRATGDGTPINNYDKYYPNMESVASFRRRMQKFFDPLTHPAVIQAINGMVFALNTESKGKVNEVEYYTNDTNGKMVDAAAAKLSISHFQPKTQATGTLIFRGHSNPIWGQKSWLPDSLRIQIILDVAGNDYNFAVNKGNIFDGVNIATKRKLTTFKNRFLTTDRTQPQYSAGGKEPLDESDYVEWQVDTPTLWLRRITLTQAGLETYNQILRTPAVQGIFTYPVMYLSTDVFQLPTNTNSMKFSLVSGRKPQAILFHFVRTEALEPATFSRAYHPYSVGWDVEDDTVPYVADKAWPADENNPAYNDEDWEQAGQARFRVMPKLETSGARLGIASFKLKAGGQEYPSGYDVRFDAPQNEDNQTWTGGASYALYQTYKNLCKPTTEGYGQRPFIPEDAMRSGHLAFFAINMQNNEGRIFGVREAGETLTNITCSIGFHKKLPERYATSGYSLLVHQVFNDAVKVHVPSGKVSYTY